MKIYDHISKFSDLHIEGFALFFFTCGLFHPLFFIPCSLYLFLLRKRIRWLPILILMSIIFLFIQQFEIEPESEIHHMFIVMDIKEGEYSERLTIKSKSVMYHITVYDTYDVGDILWIEGVMYHYPHATAPFGFNPNKYYFSEGIHGYIEVNHIEKIDHQSSFYTLRYTLMKSIQSLQSKPWLMSFIFNEHHMDDTQTNLFRELGILSIISISGIHLAITAGFIKKGLFYLNIPSIYQVVIIGLFYLLFWYLQKGSLQTTRLCLVYALIQLNRYYKLRFTKLDILHVVFLLLIFTHGYALFYVSLWLTYIIVVTIELLKPILNSHHIIYKNYLISWSISLLILPLQKEISLFAIMWMPVLLFFVSTFFFIVSLLTMIYPPLDGFTAFLFQQFTYILSMVNHRQMTMYLYGFTIVMFVLYYTMCLWLFLSKKRVILLRRILIFIIVISLPYVKLSYKHDVKIYFFDVGQGDAILIDTPNTHILIDAYGPIHDHLHHLGIKTLDAMFLTHPDLDHTKQASRVTEEMSVKTLYINPYSKYETYDVLTKKVSSGDTIIYDDLTVHILAPISQSDQANNESLVLLIEVMNTTLLFAGDIEYETEVELVECYRQELKSDILKVAHHGSDTSSSIAFLEMVKPDVAIISVGRNNRFSFPSEVVLERFASHSIMTYRTDTHGTIVLTLYKKYKKWSFYLPYL